MLFKETLLRLRSSETVIDADLFMHFVGLQVIHVAATTAHHEPDTLHRTNEAAYTGVGHRPRAVHCSFQGHIVCLATGESRMRARMKSWEAQAPSEPFAYQEIHLSLNASILANASGRADGAAHQHAAYWYTPAELL
ncbi:hypothetical protein EG328_006876 [Venturia inaequalis]|uniref:Uncharacterized protein n=1 Tax=Venturia inaequalis TaxID=5025 RepID=A0A8H3YRM5_VENIN|nr:hypothetical protein EG328_006876 [Venturia inaequalis]